MLPDAVLEERAMMVECLHAFAAAVAVFSPHFLVDPADFAELEGFD